MPAALGNVEPAAAPGPKMCEAETAGLFTMGLMLLGTMAKLVVPGLSKVKLVLKRPEANEPPVFLLNEPSTPMSEASLRVTSRKTTLMRTCGLGRSRLEMTSEIYFVVSGSATTMRLRVSGSMEKVASPTPLFG